MQVSVTIISHLVASVAFLALFILQVIRWRLRAGLPIAAATLATMFWSMSVAMYPLFDGVRAPITVYLELVRNAVWAMYLLDVLTPFRRRRFFRQSGTWRLALFCAVALAALAAGMAASYVERGPLYRTLGSTTFALINAIVVMLLVEQLFRNAADSVRWGIKFACFGVGSMYVYDFYLYSDASLFGHVNAAIWEARGVISILTVPLLAVTIARHAQWRFNFAISRRMLFNSVALTGAALYLLCMATAGYYLRFFGGNWGLMMQVTFLFGAVLLLLMVLFSGTFRSWLKVCISKHFFSYNYDYREEWIRFTRKLCERGPPIGERAIEAVAQLVESPGGALWIARESGECEQAAHWNMFAALAATEPLDGELCCFLERTEWIVELRELAENTGKYQHLRLPPWLQSLELASLVIPLLLHGKLFGFMVLAKPRSEIRLNWEVLDLLKIAGSQAVSYLAQEESSNALLVAQQFESYNRMSTFVVHDLKNLVAQLSLLVANAKKHKDSPEFQEDMLETITYSVEKMKVLLQKFMRNSAPELPTALNVRDVLKHIVSSKERFQPRPVLEIRCADVLVHANAARLERVIGHLVQNAIEATGKDGKIVVSLDADQDFVHIEISDTGQGMSPEFIEQRLFKPFVSTKPAGMGIGVFEMREYVLELGGKVEVQSAPSQGTTFRIALPVYKEGATEKIAA